MASIIDRLPFFGGGNAGNQNQEPEHTPEDPDSFVEMTLQEHLEELRVRILWSTIAVVVALGAGLVLSQPLIHQIAVQANVPDERIATFSPTEGFVTYFKVAIYIAIAIAMPVLVYQLLAFVAPGLTRNERGYVYKSMPVVTFFFVSGLAFAFFIVIPRALEFLSEFGDNVFAWNPRAEEIISFYTRLMLGVGIAFELPIVILILSKIGVLTPGRLSSARKFAFLLVMIAAAIITPTPDPFNMMLVAIPMYLLYELGIIFAKVL